MNSGKVSQDKKTIQIEKETDSTENLYSWLSLGVLILCVFAFKSSILDANNIPSASMVPTLKIGDYLFVNKMRYSFHFPFNEKELFQYDHPKRGDIVTFEPPSDSEKNYVKRLIGKPLDIFRIRQISPCDFATKVKSKSPSGKPLQLIPPEQRDYRCPGERLSDSSIYEPPVITLFEYRKEGSGEWLNFGPTEVPSKEANDILIDSDTPDALHPGLIPASFYVNSNLPVLFEETINGTQHYVLETKLTQLPDGLFGQNCNDQKIRTTGCRIPENKYLVMGDNRDNSSDSRVIGLISRDRMRGKVLVAYFSINWYAKICEAYANNQSEILQGEKIGFDLPGLSIEDQEKYCGTKDMNTSRTSAAWNFVKHLLVREIPRMDIRWYRLGTLIK